MKGLGNGLAPNKLQTIVWANDSFVYWGIYALLRYDGLKLATKIGTYHVL